MEDGGSVEMIPGFSGMSEPWQGLAQKVYKGKRISDQEALLLLNDGELPYLGMLANLVRERLNGNHAFFNRNFHIEPTNICRYHCRFCSYRRTAGAPDSWDYTLDEMVQKVKEKAATGATEVHIVGAVFPGRGMEPALELLKAIRRAAPAIHIKAYSAVELDYMFTMDGITPNEGLRRLKEAGLDSLPGGGAEIFDETVRKQICPDKTGSQTWLDIHEAAHGLQIPSNATMLYGHIESAEQRIDHMSRLRALQDRTGGFNCFIPLKFRDAHNDLGVSVKEQTLLQDLRMYAVARIYLDNFVHLKAYWPMLGREGSRVALAFGVDDLDGTIDDTTRIYAMAGAEEQNPSMSSARMIELIREAQRIPVERDSLYNSLHSYA